MELGIREWMIIIGVLLLIAVLLDGIRKMREERRNHIRVAFKMGGGVCDEDSYVDPVDREVSKPRVISPAAEAAQIKAASRVAKKVEQKKAQQKPAKTRKSVPEKIQEKTTAFASAALSNSAASKSISEGVPERDRIEPDLGEAIDVYEVEKSASANDDSARRFSPQQAQQAKHEELAERVKAKVVKDKRANTKQAAEIKEFQPAPSKQPTLDYSVAEEFLAVYVLAKNEDGFNGADLLQILLACDLRFGKRNIFHRHEYKNGTGPVQFSMANIVEPGVFDLNTIESFQTPGVCFFLSLPGPEDPLKAFDYMVETANCIVRNLDGDLKDEVRSAMTTQTLSHYRQRVQEFERRQLTMSV
ncbi:MAG: cell division protein ZipA [Pseudomonadales bacterium]